MPKTIAWELSPYYSNFDKQKIKYDANMHRIFCLNLIFNKKKFLTVYFFSIT